MSFNPDRLFSRVQEFMNSRGGVILEADAQNQAIQDGQTQQVQQPVQQAQPPTESAADIPENEAGTFISDSKLAMYANTLLKAYQTQPKGTIPAEFLTVTTQNANEVIEWIEQQLTFEDEAKSQMENGLNDVPN